MVLPTEYLVSEKQGGNMPRNKAQLEQIRAESRDQILSTARRLFAERGYDGCTVSDIARQAGMSQGNIYWYFSSKEQLLKVILEEAFEALDALFEEIAAFPGTGVERLNHLLERYIAFGQDQGGAELTIIISSLIARGDPQRLSDLGLDTAQIGAGFQRSLAAILAQAQSEGGIMPGIDPDLLAMFFFSFFNGLVFTYPREAEEVPDEVLQEAALRLLGGRNWENSE
jgi:AcrR family transcriptional regulator